MSPSLYNKYIEPPPEEENETPSAAPFAAQASAPSHTLDQELGSRGSANIFGVRPANNPAGAWLKEGDSQAQHWSPTGQPLGTVASSVTGFRKLAPKPPVYGSNGGTEPSPPPPPAPPPPSQAKRARQPTPLKSPATGNGQGSKRGKHKSLATGNGQGSKRGKWKAAPLSEYELARNRTIEANNAVLKSLGLDKPLLTRVRARSDDDSSDYNDEQSDDNAVAGATKTGRPRQDDIPPPPFENIILAYDTKLVKVGQRIANYMNGQWQVGTISSTTYSKKKWVEYPNLPKVKGVKKSDRGKLIYQEFTHALDPVGHMKTWVFLQ